MLTLKDVMKDFPELLMKCVKLLMFIYTVIIRVD